MLPVSCLSILFAVEKPLAQFAREEHATARRASALTAARRMVSSVRFSEMARQMMLGCSSAGRVVSVFWPAGRESVSLVVLPSFVGPLDDGDIYIAVSAEEGERC